MAKFCSKCGAELEEQAAFCPACGNAVEAAPAAPEAPAEPVVAETAEAPAAKAKSGINNVIAKVQEFATKATAYSKDYIAKAKQNPKMWIAPGAIGVGIIALIVVLVILIAGSGYKSALNNYVKFMSGNIKYMEKMAPQEYWDYLEEEEGYDMDEAKDEMEEYLEKIMENWEEEYGDNIKISYKVEDEKKLTSKKLKKIQEALEDQYDMDVKVKKGYKLDVEMTIKGSEDKDTNDTTLTVIQIGSKWYVVGVSEYNDTTYVSFGGLF